MEKQNKILLYISCFILAYWFMTKLVNLYDYAVIGAIYELTAIIIVISTFLMPILALIFWIKSKFSTNIKILSPIIISIISILIMIYFPFLYDN
ncbi:hypothetical protein [Mangrovimonas cancribranchiae]|uniref:Uncharacterized protein n=1 Tax=Mangrovimonas cancribranchiae TaxID=3080055 RepID=A0AAU6NWH6_9FLAO